MLILYFFLALAISFLLFFTLQPPHDTPGVMLSLILSTALVMLAYLVAQRIRNSHDRDRAPGSDPFQPSYQRARRFTVVIGVVVLVLGVIEIFALLEPPASRQMTDLTRILYAVMGPYGPAVTYIGSGVIILLWVWKRTRKK